MIHKTHGTWMTGNKKYFVKIDEKISSQVKMGNGAM